MKKSHLFMLIEVMKQLNEAGNKLGASERMKFDALKNTWRVR